jgi:calcineurin-like phosphoesterase family protein
MTLFKQAKVIYNSEVTEEEARENLIANEVENITDEDVYNEIDFLSQTYFEDELVNLDHVLDGRILCIASLGLWNGTRTGYKICKNNLKEVLFQGQGDYYKIMYNGNDVVAEDCHHDGTNYYTFRELREDTNYDILLDKLYSGEKVTQRLINKYTKSLKPYVKKIYGW